MVQAVQNSSHEIKEPAPKIPKLQENCAHEVSENPISLFRVKKLSDKAILPARASALSAGYDLSRYVGENFQEGLELLGLNFYGVFICLLAVQLGLKCLLEVKLLFQQI